MNLDQFVLVLLGAWLIGSFAALSVLVWRGESVSGGSFLKAVSWSFFAAAVGVSCGVFIVLSQALSYFAWLLEIIPSAFWRITLIPALLAFFFAFSSFGWAVRQYSEKPSENSVEKS